MDGGSLQRLTNAADDVRSGMIGPDCASGAYFTLSVITPRGDKTLDDCMPEPFGDTANTASLELQLPITPEVRRGIERNLD